MYLTAILLAVLAALLLALGTHLQHHAVTRRAHQAVPARRRDTAADAGLESGERGGSRPPGITGHHESARPRIGAHHESARADGSLRPGPGGPGTGGTTSGPTDTGTRALLTAARSPLWLLGLGLIGAEIVLNVLALGLGPVTLVQPLGMLSLIAAVVISAVVLRQRFPASLLAAIAMTIVPVGLFVGVSARFTHPLQIVDADASRLGGLTVLFALLGVGIALSRASHVSRVLTAGVLFGAVAAGAHVLAQALLGTGEPSGATGLSAGALWVLFAGVALGSAVGTWVVQTAYATGPPETVLAGLTVVDPIVAVLVGAALLGEYRGVDALGAAGLLGSGALAVLGVLMLARFHPAARPAAMPAVPFGDGSADGAVGSAGHDRSGRGGRTVARRARIPAAVGAHRFSRRR